MLSYWTENFFSWWHTGEYHGEGDSGRKAENTVDQVKESVLGLRGKVLVAGGLPRELL